MLVIVSKKIDTIIKLKQVIVSTIVKRKNISKFSDNKQFMRSFSSSMFGFMVVHNYCHHTVGTRTNTVNMGGLQRCQQRMNTTTGIINTRLGAQNSQLIHW